MTDPLKIVPSNYSHGPKSEPPKKPSKFRILLGAICLLSGLTLLLLSIFDTDTRSVVFLAIGLVLILALIPLFGIKISDAYNPDHDFPILRGKDRE